MCEATVCFTILNGKLLSGYHCLIQMDYLLPLREGDHFDKILLLGN